MDISGQYLTYSEYEALGGTLTTETPFNLLEFEARRQIDIRTFGRLKDLEVIPEEVKLCEYKLINTIQSYAQTDTSNSVGNVASENIDGYSVSYITLDRVSEVIKSKSNQIDDIIRTYLLGVIVNGEHIMYVGVK